MLNQGSSQEHEKGRCKKPAQLDFDSPPSGSMSGSVIWNCGLLLNEGGSQRRHVEKYELIDCYKS